MTKKELTLWFLGLFIVVSFVLIDAAKGQEVIATEECYQIYSKEYCDWNAESVSVHGEQYEKPTFDNLTTDEVGGWKIGTQVSTGHGDSYEFTPDIAKTIRQAFPEGDWRWAGVLVGCESRGNWYAVSPTSDYGLFQINRIWLNGIVDPFSVHTQVTKAQEVYSYQGRGAWVCNRVAAGISGS